MNPARRTLDPRAKLYLLLVANLMLFFHVGLATQIVMVVLFLLPLLAAARWRTALNFGVTYAVLTALGMLDPDALGLPWLHVVSALAVGVTFSMVELSVSIGLAVALIGCTTFAISVGGVFVGHIFGTRYKNRAEFVGGAILILIGVKILLEHFGVL